MGPSQAREAICRYYNDEYGTSIVPENVMVFAGRPGIYTTLAFLKKDVQVRIGNVEWPAYLDIMTQTNTNWRVVPFTKENNFHPNSAYFDRTGSTPKRPSSRSSPSQATRRANAAGAEPRTHGDGPGQERNPLDEAYEMFHSSGGVSGLKYVKDLENSNVFIAGACTKGLQCRHSSGMDDREQAQHRDAGQLLLLGMGGVSHPSQLYAVKLLEPQRVKRARRAVQQHYDWQRKQYGEAFEKMGLKLYSGDGGFYHWCRSPRASPQRG